jgi:hypothetical protein
LLVLLRVFAAFFGYLASAHALAASPFKAGYVSAKHGALSMVTFAPKRP